MQPVHDFLTLRDVSTVKNQARITGANLLDLSGQAPHERKMARAGLGNTACFGSTLRRLADRIYETLSAHLTIGGKVEETRKAISTTLLPSTCGCMYGRQV